MKLLKLGRKTFVISAAALLAAAGGVWALWPDSQPPPSEPAATDQATTQQETSNTKESAKPGATTQTEDTSDSDVTVAELKVSTNFSIDKQYVYVSAIVKGATSGTCKLNFTKDDKTFTDSGSIAQIPPYRGDYGCSLQIARPNKGTWNYYVAVSSGSKSGRSTTQEVEVE